MVEANISRYLATIGRKGGLKSRRTLGPDQARAMVRIREARRAYREFHDTCFWSNPPGFEVREQDIPWVIEQLKAHGGAEGWERARRLCR
ncbi:MAG: hypothetical protein ACP5I4_16815 [Oceanipulchritudo sp.]